MEEDEEQDICIHLDVHVHISVHNEQMFQRINNTRTFLHK